MLNVIERVGNNIVSPLLSLWEGFLNAIPYVIGGLIVAVFGFLLGEVLELILIKILRKIKFNERIYALNISKDLKKLDLAHFLGVIVKWYVFVIFLVPAAAMARLGEMTTLIMDFARWVPNFIVAIFIVLFGWILADYLSTKIETTQITSKYILSGISKILIVIFTLSIAMNQIGIKVDLVNQTFLILVGAIAFGFSLAIGIAFGLGLKDEARDFVKKIKKKL